MRPAATIATASLIMTILAGCQTRQSQLAQLQAKYNAQLTQYTSDCYDVIEDPPTSPRIAKCNAESDQMKPVFAQIQLLTKQIAAE